VRAGPFDRLARRILGLQVERTLSRDAWTATAEQWLRDFGGGRNFLTTVTH
jgi:hypothetical protein